MVASATKDVLQGQDLTSVVLSFMPPSALPGCLPVSSLFLQIGRPLLRASVFGRAAAMKCKATLVLENQQNVISRVMIRRQRNAVAALSSAVDGNGRLSLLGVSNGNPASSELSLPYNRAVAGFDEAAKDQSLLAIVTSRDVREEEGDESDSADLGYGAELCVWKEGDVQASATVPLERSEFLCGKNPFSSSSSSEDDPVLFKSRATHVWYDEGNRNPYLRTLVHNPSLAAEQQALLATYDCYGALVQDKCTLLSWGQEAENIPPSPPSAAEAAATAKNRFGGVACASTFIDSSGALIATGHDRDAHDGVARVRLWNAMDGANLLTLDGPQFPTRSFSTAGVTRIALSKNWIAIACVDGYAHLWHRGEASAPAAVATLSATGALRPAAGSGGPLPAPKNKQVVEALAVEGPFLVVAFAHGQRVARESTVALFRLEDAAGGDDGATEGKVTMCGHLPLKDALQDREGKIKVTSVGMNLETCGKVVLACAFIPEEEESAPRGLVLTFDFLAPSVSS